MKVRAYCNQCGISHTESIDVTKPTNFFTDWYIKHLTHQGVGFDWPGRTNKPSWVDGLRAAWRFVKWKAGVGIAAIPLMMDPAYRDAAFSYLRDNPSAIASFLHNADVKIAYGTEAEFTITIASLASSAGLLTGQEGTSISNTSNKYLDYGIAGQITVGTTPTTNTQINVAIVSQLKSGVWPLVFDGTNSAETVVNQQQYDQICRILATIQVVSTTSDITYPFGPNSLASLYGGQCPPVFSCFVSHNTGAALNATGSNHYINTIPTYLTVA